MSIKRSMIAAIAALAFSLPANADPGSTVTKAPAAPSTFTLLAHGGFGRHARRWWVWDARPRIWRNTPGGLRPSFWSGYGWPFRLWPASSILPRRPQGLFPRPSRLLPAWPFLPIRSWLLWVWIWLRGQLLLELSGRRLWSGLLFRLRVQLLLLILKISRGRHGGLDFASNKRVTLDHSNTNKIDTEAISLSF